MKKCSTRLFGVCVIISLITACGKSITELDTVKLTRNKPQKIEIADLSDAWDTILNSSTKEFIGGHPVDESFLGMVTAD